MKITQTEYIMKQLRNIGDIYIIGIRMTSIRIKNIKKNEEGTTAVEFAIIAPLLFVILFAVVELGILYVRMNVVSDGIEEVSRIIKTGQKFSASRPTCNSEADCFVNQFCDNVDTINKCTHGINFSYDVQAFTALHEINNNTPLPCPSENGGGGASNNPSFNAGDSSSIVMIRVCYELPIINPYLRTSFKALPNGNIRYAKTEIFANEPY